MKNYITYAERCGKTVPVNLSLKAKILQCLVNAGLDNMSSGKGMDIRVIYELCQKNHLTTKTAPIPATYFHLSKAVKLGLLAINRHSKGRRVFYLGSDGEAYLKQYGRFDNPNAPLMRKWLSKQEI